MVTPEMPPRSDNWYGWAKAAYELLGFVFATGKVRALAVVSVDPTGPDGPTSLGSGLALLRESVAAWTA